MSQSITPVSTALIVALACPLQESQARGPLTVCPVNSYWFADSQGDAVFLTGSHTWANRQERGVEGRTPHFDYKAYLDFLESHGHNFIRLWAWEHARWMQFVSPEVPIRYAPSPWLRTGPGKAIDGQPRFDLTRFNPDYFERLRDRIESAQRRGIYVAVMLFQGFSLDKRRGRKETQGNAWHGHPMNTANNVNGINGNPSGDDSGRETHTLGVPEITRLQEAYVRRTIEAVGDFDNVLWEIGNECHRQSVPWQYHMIRFIREVESKRPTQHLIGMTGAPINNDALMNSPADWISPIGQQYLTDPPVSSGETVVVVDTDHIKPWDHSPSWVWKNLLRGNNFILMDGYMDFRLGTPEQPDPKWNPTRQAMGLAQRLAERVDLKRMPPQPNLTSTGYCLADPGRAYLVYQPTQGGFSMQLAEGKYQGEWLNPTDGKVVQKDSVVGKDTVHFSTPLDHAMLLLLQRVE